MSALLLNDLEINTTLDQDAMTALTGGGGWNVHNRKIMSCVTKYKIHCGKKYCRKVTKTKLFACKTKTNKSDWHFCGCA